MIAAGEVTVDGAVIGKRYLDTTEPLNYREYPEGWKPRLDVDKAAGLDALIEEVDEFAAKSQAVCDAVEVLFRATSSA